MQVENDRCGRTGRALALLALMAAVALPAAAESRPSDATIDDWVEQALRSDPRVDASSIEVSTQDGIVKLRGTLKDPAARQFAELETRKISGVRGVIDELSVRPVHRDDSEIRADIFTRLRDDPSPALMQIDVDVSNGVVKLRGEVGSWSERQEAALRAREVRGVSVVENELTMHYDSSRSDESIQSDIVDAISRDVYLVGLPIRVAVRDGKVSLSGSVGNAYEKERAADAAWVSNVVAVENDLEVKWAEERGVRETAAPPDDSDVVKAVKAELDEDLRLADPYEIDVDSADGRVTLRGKVPTYDQKRRAENDARDVVGVAWVSDRLKVRSGWLSDDAIRKEILKRFDGDYLLWTRDVDVQVKDGVATLSGRTSTYRERNHAIDVAARVPGVVDVVDRIRTDWTPPFNDVDLVARIQGRLRADAETRWVADRIDVTVEDGIAKLTGEVYSWSERAEAAEVTAHTDGVRWVDDRLRVKGVDYPWGEWYSRQGRYGSFVMSPR